MFNKLMIVSFYLVAIVFACAQERVGDSLMEIGDYSGAIKEYATVETTAAVNFKLAKIFTATGNTSKAIRSYEDGLQMDKNATKPRFELARLQLAVNEPLKSLSIFKNLVEEYPQNATFLYYQGQSQEKMKMEDQAMDIYKRVLELDPDYRSARVDLVALLIKNRETLLAIKYAKEALDKDPDDIKFNSLIAQAYFSAKNYKKAAEHFERLFELKNDTEFNRRTLGVSYFEDAQWQKAIENFKIFLKEYEPKDAAIYFMKSTAHLRLKEYDEAQNAIEYSILFRRPSLSWEYLQLASVMAAKEDYKGTFEAMKLAYQEDKEDPLIAYQLAVSADRYFKDKKTILTYYERYLDKFGETDGYGEVVTARASDLKREIFMNADN